MNIVVVLATALIVFLNDFELPYFELLGKEFDTVTMIVDKAPNHGNSIQNILTTLYG